MLKTAFMRSPLSSALPLCVLAIPLACTSDPDSGRSKDPTAGSSNALWGGRAGNDSGVGGTSAGSTPLTGGATTGGAAAITGGTGTVITGGSGGTSSTGGAVNAGGSSAGASKGGGGGTAGAAATGGTLASSGNGGRGGASGAAAQGGASQTGGSSATGGANACTWSGAPSSSNGELTCYWFGQGTAKAPECPNGFKTFCGYCGTESGEKPSDFQYPCAVGYVTDTVEHISTPHFAAFPGSTNVAKNCGMCVELSFMGRTVTATIIDACPSCNSLDHIDVSLSAAEALGMVQWIGNPKQGVTWKAVPCPVTESIYVTFNGGYQGQLYFQNLAFPIASASVDGKPANGNNSAYWDFGTDVSGKTVTLTDTAGHTVQGTIPTSKSGGSLGAQFPLTCQ